MTITKQVNKKRKTQGNNRKSRTPDLVSTRRGERPSVRGPNGRKLPMIFVGHKGGSSFWQSAESHAIPTCNSLVITIIRNMADNPDYSVVNEFTGGLSDFYSANPNLVIDSMAMLMTDGHIDQADFDEVFDQVYPFSATGWEIDANYEKEAIKGYMEMSNERLKGYPKKEDRTIVDATEWLNTKPKMILVKKWKGEVKANGRKFKVNFALEKAALPPDVKTGVTRYFVGNRAMGDKPIHLWLRLPGTPDAKYIRGMPGNTNMRAMPSPAKIRIMRREARQMTNPTAEDNFGDDVVAKLLRGETVSNSITSDRNDNDAGAPAPMLR